jgi:hypothetical protein
MMLALPKKRPSPAFLILLGVGLIVLVVKAMRLGYFSLWLDEGFYYLAAQKIRALGYPLYPSGYILFKSIFYSYLLAGFSFLSGLSVAGLRFLSVLIHAATPLVIYLSLKDILKKEVLLATGLLLYVSLWQTEYARTILYFSLAALLMTWGIVLFFKNHVQGHRNLYALVWVAALFTHQLTIALGLCFVALLVLKGKKFFSKKNIIAGFLWLLLFLFIQLQEVLLWKVGQVYSTQGVSSVRGIIDYFFKGFTLDYYKVLRRSFPFYSALFFAGSLVFLGLLLFKKVRKRDISQAETFILFLIVTFIGTIFVLGFMKTHTTPRYLFPFIIEMFLVNSYFLFEGARFMLQKLVRARPAILLSLLVTLLVPFFLVEDFRFGNVRAVLGRDYGDPIRSDILTTSGRFFPEDNRSASDYVKRHLRNDDSVLAMNMIFQKIYGRRVDGWLFSGGPGTWDAGVLVNGTWRDFYLGVPWIRSFEELQTVIDTNLAKGQRVWVVTSPSEERLDHINRGIRDFLLENRWRVKWVSQDGLSRAYLFDASIERGRFYEAEWGIVGKGAIIDVDNLSPQSYVHLRGPYRTSFIPLAGGWYHLTFGFKDSDGGKILLRLKSYQKTLKERMEVIADSAVSFHYKIPKNEWYSFEIVPVAGTIQFDFIEKSDVPELSH